MTKIHNIAFELKPVPSLPSSASSKNGPVELFATIWQAYNVGQGKVENLSRRQSIVTEIVPLEISATHLSSEWKQEELDAGKFHTSQSI